MGKEFSGFMLVCDMDGTLLNSKLEVSDENVRAIEYFVDNGGVFTIATGRMELGVRKYLRLLPVNAPVILYNGASIYDFEKEKSLWDIHLEGEISVILKDLLNKFTYLGIEIFEGGDSVYLLRENEETEKHRKKEGFAPQIITVDQIPDCLYKVILTADPNSLKDVENYLKGKDTTFRMVYSEKQFLEILNKEASKGRALRELAKILGVSMSNVISMGDNQNDIEMVEMSGTGFAVENAQPDLLRIADYCSVHHDRHAVAYVVNWLKTNISRQMNQSARLE